MRNISLTLLVALAHSVCCAASDVLQISYSNFNSLVAEGPVLIEFYAPWCGHCQRLAPAYEKVASELSSSGGGVKVGKVDCTVEKALCTRFGVPGYPSIYLIKETKVYTFNGSRNVEGFLHFVNGGYEKTTPLDFWSSPFGPLGTIKGVAVQGGATILSAYEYLVREHQLPWYAAAGVVFAAGVSGTLIISGLFAFLMVPKPVPVKRD